MTKIRIPTTSNPFRVMVNGVEYAYEAGTEQEVPDAVALVIEQHLAAAEGYAPDSPAPGSGVKLGGADWNAAEGEPGHVLNRSHWVEVSEGEILPEMMLEFTDGQAGVTEPFINLIPGEEYCVRWKGTEYKCTAIRFEADDISAPALGNLDAMTETGDSGEPFVILACDAELAAITGVSIMFVALDGSESASVSISGRVETVHTLDEKFLPGGLGKKIILDLSTGECNMPFEQVARMESGEIQAALCLVGEEDIDGSGHRLTAFAVDKVLVNLGGMEDTIITFAVASFESDAFSGIPNIDSGDGQIYRYTWSATGLRQDDNTHWLLPIAPSDGAGNAVMPNGGNSRTATMLCEYDPSIGTIHLRRPDQFAINGIVLRGGGGDYLLTVDDNGGLVTTKVTGLA